MRDSALRKSPLDSLPPTATTNGASTDTPGVRCTELKFLGQLDIRGNLQDSAFETGIRAIIGIALPNAPNGSAANETTTALWLGPDEWLLITPAGRETELQSQIRDALRGIFFAVTDVTDNQVILRMSGRDVFDLLAKGCSLNLSTRAFKPGACAQTTMASVAVTVHYLEEGAIVDLIVRRSFSEYLTLWLQDAALEFGFVSI